MIGRLINDRYRIISELGRGGMGTVYRGHDELLNRDVAVKVLGSDPRLPVRKAGLLEEARAAAALDHPNIVSVFDVLENGGDFIIQQLVPGPTLQEAAPASIPEAIAIARQICDALEHAHSRGIVHRDVKPGNVILAGDGLVRLADFGLATGIDPDTAGDRALSGTIYYMAPEQSLGPAVDGRADLYSLGVMLFEWTTGRLPFEADDPFSVISSHLHQPPAPPQSLNPAVSQALNDAILRLLAKQPDDRYPTAAALKADLDVLSGGSVLAPGRTHHHLPVEVTSFIGREQELAMVRTLMSESRMTTLSGSGGCGKTRLALRAALGIPDRYPHGVWWVGLMSLEDPALVPQTIGTALGIRETSSPDPLADLVGFLHDRRLLLVLDNCEHLIEACARVVDVLLHACPAVDILATSREPLGVEGERVFRVPSLQVPPSGVQLSTEQLLGIESVRLFYNRAAAVLPEFRPTGENAGEVARICGQLDGIPLAIELAAARVNVLTVSQIRSRLVDRFRLLTSGRRTALPRHQTLRATIDWSYSLLDQSEHVLFRRLSVFVGGWTLEAAERICGFEPLEEHEVLDLLVRLVDKSMAIVDRAPGTATRYRFLETIRQYAREKLIDTGESHEMAARHFAFFTEFARAAERHFLTPAQLDWLKRMDSEHENLRSAFEWSLNDSVPAADCLRLAAPLGHYWKQHTRLREGRQYLESALHKADTGIVSPEMANVLLRIADTAYYQSDYAACRVYFKEALAIFRKLGPDVRQGEAEALIGLANMSTEVGDYKSAPALFHQALEIYQEIGYPVGISNTRRNLGWAAMRLGDYASAQVHLETALEGFREIDEMIGAASTLAGLGEAAIRTKRYEQAWPLLEESLLLRRKYLGDISWGVAVNLGSMGWLALRQGDYERMRTFLGESLRIRLQLDDKGGTAWCLEKLAEAAFLEKDELRAVRLYGAAAALRRPVQSVIDPVDQPAYEQMIAELKSSMGEPGFETAWLAGEALSPAEAAALALST